MLIEVTGILDDNGRPLDATLPADPRRVLHLQQGDEHVIRVTLKDWAGVPVNLDAGEHLVLTARTPAAPASRRLFIKTSARAAGRSANVHDIPIVAADTRAITITRAIYDIAVKRTGGNYIVIPTSQLIIARTVADLANLP